MSFGIKAESGPQERCSTGSGKPYSINAGDGAFYGPKIDFNVRDALKRYHQLGTIQLDFNMPERFELGYIGQDNSEHRPVMVHRAVLGSIERFMGILIEHTAGAFPFWLAPVQARIVPIKDPHYDYCREFMKELKALGYRVDLDDRNESMGLKTREAQTAKIPFSLVAGDREAQANQFAVRKYGERESKVMTQDEILALFHELNDVPDQSQARHLRPEAEAWFFLASSKAPESDLKVERLTRSEALKRFPEYHPPEHFEAVLEPNAGYLEVENAVTLAARGSLPRRGAPPRREGARLARPTRRRSLSRHRLGHLSRR